MSIIPVGAIAAPIAPAGIAAPGAAGTGGAEFGSQLTQSLQSLQSAQSKADDLGVKAATGSLTDVHDYMIASTEANMATQLTVAVRNKALEAFNEIMRMQA